MLIDTTGIVDGSNPETKPKKNITMEKTQEIAQELTPQQKEYMQLVNTLGQLLYTIHVDVVKARELYNSVINPDKTIDHE